MTKLGIALLCLAVLSCLAISIRADMFLHGCMAGSNNKLNEQSDTRDTQRRMFNSQNGNNGGYNAITDGQVPTPFYYVGSSMSLYWTNQHGAGPNGVTKGDVTIQLMCGNYDNSNFFGYPFNLSSGAGMRDGTTTSKIQDTPLGQSDTSVGQHEPQAWYDNCTARQRNLGLFTADQTLQNSATFTLQNNNGNTDDGNRGAFECPEERDYYPYWHPATFMDVAHLARDTSQCRNIRSNSQNVQEKNLCTIASANNAADCATAGGSFTKVTSWHLPPPDCLLGPFTETNHLGFSSQNTDGTTYLAGYNWSVSDTPASQCTLRVRYNLTQHEIDRSDLDSRFNGANSPTSQDPSFTFASDVFPNHPLGLAINSNQYPRTFQDRTHIFSILTRPDNLRHQTIFNLGVIGKRGALQDIFPGMENDFCPRQLEISHGDSIHFQIYGPNTGTANNRNNGAGGDNNGDVRGNRHNIVQVSNLDGNIPVTADQSTMFQDRATTVFFAYGAQSPANCVKGENGETDAGNCGKINTPLNGYFQHSPIKFNVTDTFFYMSSRNNINTNRDQKGVLNVAFGIPVIGLIFIILGSVVIAAGAGVGGIFYAAKRNPTGRAAQIVASLKKRAPMRY